MAYTHRTPVNLTQVNSLMNTLDYITNPEKTLTPSVSAHKKYNSLDEVVKYSTNIAKTFNDKNFVATYNCTSVLTAEDEMRKTLTKYGQWKENSRVAYHTVISFSREEGITNDQLLEFGKAFCEKFYKNYQCVIACHINETKDGRGSQPHIHIVSCAIEKDTGKRLRDDIFTSPTSLVNMKKACDQLCITKGYSIIQTERSQRIFGKKVNYIKSLLPSQTKTIESLIDKYKPLSTDIETLLENIKLETGCEIKRTGKNIAIRLYGQKKFKRLSSLPVGYTEKDLQKYFSQRQHMPLPENYLDNFEDEEMLEKASLLAESLYKTQTVNRNIQYTKFEYKKLKSLQKLEKLMFVQNYMKENHIGNRNDLMRVIQRINIEVVKTEKMYEQMKSKLQEELNEQNQLRAYLSMDREKEGETETYKRLEKKYGTDLEKIRKRLNEIKNKTADLQKELFKLNQLKEKQKMNSELFEFVMKMNGETELETLQFSKKQIISQDENKTVITIPYMKGKIVHLNTSQLSLNEYGRFVYYVIPEEQLTVQNMSSTVNAYGGFKVEGEIITIPKSCKTENGFKIPYTETIVCGETKERIKLQNNITTKYQCIHAKTGKKFFCSGQELLRQCILAEKLIEEEPEVKMTGEELLGVVASAKEGMQKRKKEDSEIEVFEGADIVEIELPMSLVDEEYSTDKCIHIRIPYTNNEIDLPRERLNGNVLSLQRQGKEYFTITTKNKIYKQKEECLVNSILKQYELIQQEKDKNKDEIEK